MAMASFAFKPLQETQIQVSSFAHCKSSSTVNPFKFLHPFHISTVKPAFTSRLSLCLQVRAHVTTHLEAKLPCDKPRNVSRNTITTSKAREQKSSGLSGFSPTNPTNRRRRGQSSLVSDTGSVVEDDVEKRVMVKERQAKTRLKLNSQNRNGMGPQFSSTRSKDGGRVKSTSKKTQDNEKGRGNYLGTKDNGTNAERVGRRGSKKIKDESPEQMLRIGLDMCSKTGDIVSAIKLYDLARKEKVSLEPYHYAVLLYLCSSAAAGVLQPAKSGSGNRTLTPQGLSKEIPHTDSDGEIEQPRKKDFGTSQLDSDFVVDRSDKGGLNYIDFPAQVVVNDSKTTSIEKNNTLILSDGFLESYPDTLEEIVLLMKSKGNHKKVNSATGEPGVSGIEISEDVKKYALKRGFQIYENMLLEKVAINEATFTSVARMAMSLGDGDMAFEIVKQMKESGISPRLRSYGPALSVFCNNGDVEKASIVEQHMLEQGIYPEEPELEALLRVSVEAGQSDKVYYLLHKLRASVRQVLPSTADVIEKWFTSNLASKVGMKKWSRKMIMEAIKNGGGGWHGQGWLGKGKWTVSHTSVGSDGFCRFCGEKLVTIDLDPVETENFARSVASLALQRDKSSSFQKFQQWLDYYGPFEAVVDAANIGLYSQRHFKPSKVNAVVNGIRQMLPSKRWPLLVLHNRHINGDHKMNEPFNKTLIEKWRHFDALYATPTGSNDDWYWLYAAIKFKSLIVTNDEMRDHLFQLLGKDFFPRWKERHQVRFTFNETGPVFHMPPPCSVVIQESEKGHWHIPIVSESKAHGERPWLCITRTASPATGKKSSMTNDDFKDPGDAKKRRSSGIRRKSVPRSTEHGNHSHRKPASAAKYKNLKNILSSSLLPYSHSILQDLEDSEDFGGCTIDFQI